jgi:hypothetical protein
MGWQEESSSFLQKRTKKLLLISCGRYLNAGAKFANVLLLFSKRSAFFPKPLVCSAWFWCAGG